MSAPTEQHLAGQEPITATASQATSDPIRDQNTSDLSPESRPELGMNGVTDGMVAAAPNVGNATKVEKLAKGEVLVESHPINEGLLNYKGPGLKGLIFSKKYFWLSDAPLEHGNLSGYLNNEKSKDIAHPNAAHASQTGKGLLFYAKRAEDKGHPQGMFNLADVTDVVKGNFNDFGFSLNGHKHNFQAINKSEKDSWLVTIETKAAEAKTAREGIVGSSGYKSQLEKYGTGVAATTGTPRSRSRGMMANKSRERKTKDTTTHTTPEAAAAAFDTTPETATGTTTGDAPNTVADTTTGATSGTTTGTAPGATNGEHVGEAAAVGAVAGVATARNGSTSEEEKSKAAKKSRSQSRNNKRSSIFGGLLGKKEDKNLDKEEKKEDKADMKELKKEEKAEKKEDKAIRKEDNAVAKEIKHEDKAEKRSEKQELKEQAKDNSVLEKEAKHQGVAKTGDFDAVAVASRVVGEPVVPAEETATGIEASGVAPVAGAESTVAETTRSSTTRETAQKPNKRNSIFGSIFGKKDAVAPASMEIPPAVPSKEEPSTLPSTAPQLDDPVTSPTAETTAATTETPVAAAEATTPAAATSPIYPTDKRRTSFFGNLGTKKERRTGGTSDNELTDGEGKKQSSGGFGGLLRKASRAQKGSSPAATKDAANIPLPTETPAEATTNGETLTEKVATTEGETRNMTGVHEQTPVSAAA
ncbi:MAG: hypothetical protein ALECFALPRED_003520 [Alectoria fallacina]|uniref:PH domain-containing protein n=1 Tax=Alectoria fallacina TaxID=1903189 RepID=A0A8H3FIT7_9LECA|nr:MAG: hypothetical protein ALECFALPRED_003520 [Alectoria fallacina]